MDKEKDFLGRGENRTPLVKKQPLFSIKSDSLFRFGAFLSAGLLVVLFQLMLGLTAAWAGPPFFTDDPEPVEYKHGEFYIASQYIDGRTGKSATLPHFEFTGRSALKGEKKVPGFKWKPLSI
jgi:hypothetical protein